MIKSPNELAPRQVMLDNAAATPVDKDVARLMFEYETEKFYNPSAPYAPARALRAELDDARARIAHYIGTRPSCVTFTAGATEANNLAFAAVSRDAHVITLATEHPSITALAKAHPHTLIVPGVDGRVSAEQVAAAITDNTELISIECANGELGAIQPLRQIAKVIEEARNERLAANNMRPLYFHSDASQAAATKAINVASFGVDMLTLSAQKIYGPKQVGLLFAREGLPLRPLILGGGQEGGLRSGTENVSGIMGFAAAIDLLAHMRAQDAKRMERLRDRLQKEIMRTYPEALVMGPHQNKLRLPSHVHVAFPPMEARRLLLGLEQFGVYVGTGSACAASKMQVSPALHALGVDDAIARGSLRFTLSRHTTEEDISYALAALSQVIDDERARLERM